MRHSRSAFATMLAIALLGLVTVALAALVAVSRSDHQRTESDIAQAQLRQIILAAVIDTNTKALNWPNIPGSQNWTLDMPAEGGSVKMEMSSESPTHASVRMIASLGKNRTTQSLKFTRIDLRWKLIEVSP